MTVSHQLVLRGLAAARGIAVPTGSREREREALWAHFGVQPDLLSRTCLVWRLPLDDDSPVGRRLSIAYEAGDPVHLTDRDLRTIQRVELQRGTEVLVCENPRAVEALAEQGVAGWAAVCAAGEPNLVVDKVLADAAESGADLDYHGDFDWPGVAIANRAVERYGVAPWRMSADDYSDAVSSDGPPLLGAAVEPAWDPELGAAMRSHGHARHEESVLAGLIEALVAS